MSDRILLWPDPRLKQKAEPVTEITPAIRERAQGLVRLMNEERDGLVGIGLAATQIGWPVRILAIKWFDRPITDWSQAQDLVLVNPRIIAYEGPILGAKESCLSFPGIEVKIDRHNGVSIEATDLDGNLRYHCSEGIVARCAQHELDHLDGITMIDRLTPARRIAIGPKLRALERRQGGA